jgi:hypothetical protein
VTAAIVDRVHGKCAHRRYRLTCEQMDALRADAGERCHICQKLERYTTGLRIDHDHDTAIWAVPGLLCTPCNAGLERGWLSGPEVGNYLANPWYIRSALADLPDVFGGLFPVIPVAEAKATVRRAADALRAANADAYNRCRAELIDACRIARNVGATVREVARVADYWSTETLGALTK